MSTFQLVLISYSHKNAPVEFRDRITLDTEAILDFIHAAAQSPPANIREMTAISTCNRTEFYILTDTPSQALPFICEQYKKQRNVRLDEKESAQPLIVNNQEAAEHLLAVAAGLESMMLGENQILAQVKDGYELLLSSPQEAPVLNRLFREAIRAGKAVRTETDLCKGSVSVSLAAVELARKIYSNFKSRHVVLIGAGETAEKVGLHFLELGVSQFSVLNRGAKRRQALAKRIGAQAHSLEHIPECLVTADVLVTATSSPTHLIDHPLCRTAVKQRQGRALLMIDISTPRNIDPAVADIPEIYLYNMDDIQFVITDNLEKRKREIPAARKIVQALSTEFWEWYQTLEVVPTISKLHAYFDAVREQEVQYYQHKTGKKEYQRLEEMSKRLIRKLLHYPIMDLRQQGESGNHDLSKIDALWTLFRLRELEDNKE